MKTFGKLMGWLKRNRRGQAMTEYIIIVAIIAIASIAVVTLFGKQIRALFAGATQQLAGDSTATVDQQYGQAAPGEVDKDITTW